MKIPQFPANLLCGTKEVKSLAEQYLSKALAEDANDTRVMFAWILIFLIGLPGGYITILWIWSFFTSYNSR